MSYWSGTRDHTTGSKEFIIQVENVHLNPPPDFTLRAVGTFLGSKMCCNPGWEKSQECACPVLVAWRHQSKDTEQEAAVPSPLVWVR